MTTQKELKELFEYNPATGNFVRLVSVSSGAMVGDVAGCVDGRYIRIGINDILYLAHRLVWLYVYGIWPENQIDHINHNGLDNRLKNLRCVNGVENNQNKPLQKNNKSGVTGVYFCNTNQKWISQIKAEGRRITLTSSEDKFEAICARLSANNKFNFHENHGKRRVFCIQ